MADNGTVDDRIRVTHFTDWVGKIKCGFVHDETPSPTHKHLFTQVEDEVTCADCRSELGLPPLE